MSRKIVKTVRSLVSIGNSLGVTLPRSWLRSFGLDVGDKVVVLMNGKVTIEPLKKKKETKQ